MGQALIWPATMEFCVFTMVTGLIFGSLQTLNMSLRPVVLWHVAAGNVLVAGSWNL